MILKKLTPLGRGLEHGCIHTKLLQLCLIVQDTDSSPSDSSVEGFFRQEYWHGCHALLQGIFPTQGSNPCFLTSALIGVGGRTGRNSLPLAPPEKPRGWRGGGGKYSYFMTE